MQRRRINWILSDLIRKVMKHYLEWSARLNHIGVKCWKGRKVDLRHG